MYSVQIIRPVEGLPISTGHAILDLASAIWPSAAGEAPRDYPKILAGWRTAGAVHFLISDDQNSVLAHALLFRRVILTPVGSLFVGALATVCVLPAWRGQGWGRDVVRAAFNYLPELGAEVALFQTAVPHFYEKLGARMVDNNFFNSANTTNPFWDNYQMIYPASFAWPDGPIDINGPGY